MKKVFLALACAFLVWGGQEVLAEKNLLPLAEDNYDPAIVDNIVTFPLELEKRKEWKTEALGTESSLVTIFTNFPSGNGILIQRVNMVLGTIAIFYFVLLGSKFVIARGDEERMTKYKDYFGWMIVGLAIISVAEFLAFEIFDPASGKAILTELSFTEELTNKVHQIKLFIQILIGGIMLVKMMMSGYDLVTGSESDESIQQEKGFLKAFFLGTGLILMAEVLTRILSATLGDPAGGGFSWGNAEESAGAATAAAAERGISEVVGIINFALTFVGIVAVLMLILSSLYYVISFGSDDQMGRAKKMIFSCIFGIVVIVSSFVLIRFMIR